jgi:hypothetical protein
MPQRPKRKVPLMKTVFRMILRIAITIVMSAGGRAEAASPTDPSGTWLVEDGRARIRIERCGPARGPHLRLCRLDEEPDRPARSTLPR